jgi:hypothetical protein
LGDSGRYAFNNRSILEKRAVQQLPTAAAASLTSQLSSGRITLSPQTNAKGFRWIDRPSSTLWAARIGGFPCKINHLRVIF